MNDIQSVVLEYFDTRDADTRKALLSLNEGGENALLIKLTSRLYDHITKKITDLDFGSIPNSMGDITAIENYNQLLECVEVMRGILKQYNQPTKDTIDIIEDAIKNVEKRKPQFELGFKLNKELPISIYCTTVLAIISSISLLIATSIEFIKDPKNDNFDISFKTTSLRKSKDSLLFDSLKKFNESCKKGDMDNVLNAFNKAAANNMTGVEILAVVIAVPLLLRVALSILPYLRELIYFFYYSRVRISDYLSVQAELLQMNSYQVERNEMIDDVERAKIAAKQRSIADKLNKMANTIEISEKSAETKAYNEIKADSKEKFTADSLESDSVLF